MTAAELRILRLPADASLVPRDRRADVRVGQHGQDAGQRGLPQARRLLAARTPSSTPERAACSTLTRAPLKRRRHSAPSATRSLGWSHASARAIPPARSMASRSGDRPAMLEDGDGRGRARRDRVGHEPDLFRKRREPVLAGLRPGERADLGALLAGCAEADERAGDRAELDGLVGRQPARLHRRHVAVVVLAHDQEIDEPHDLVLAQALSARRRSRRGSRRSWKPTTSTCMGPNVMVSPPARIFCFSLSNSASVSTPPSSRLLSCVSASTRSAADRAGGGAGAGGGGRGRRGAAAAGAAYCCCCTSASCLVLRGLVLLLALHVLAGGVRGAADHGGAHQGTATH